MNRYAKGRIKLKKGEQQRPNGTFAYRWTDRYGSRRAVYAKTIIELRIKEEAILKDAIDGIKFLGPNVTINSYFEIWKKIKSVQIQCATDKAFRNIVKTATVKQSKASAKIKGLKKKTTYYVRVRYSDGTGYSAWSKVKKIKTK